MHASSAAAPFCALCPNTSNAALACYDRAFELRELVKAPDAALASIVGAKGAVLNEFGRSPLD